MSVEQFYHSISEQLNSGVIIFDLNSNVVVWNKFLAIHANKTTEQIVGKNLFDLFPELPKKWFDRKVSGVVQLQAPSFCSWAQRHHLIELPHTRPISTDSEFMAQNCTFLPIETDNEIQHICLLIEDATDVCHYQGRLTKTLNDLALANRMDGLTQIYNRKYWEECLGSEFSRARRYDNQLSLIMFDLDHFKRLNDNYGHLCGDMVLIELAKIIKPLVRDCDFFGRYGGEEFAITLPETTLDKATEVAERIRKAIYLADLTYQQQEIATSASVGVASIDPEDRRYEDLIGKADIALFQAKSEGRNCTCVAQ